jgi:hypothetical protein
MLRPLLVREDPSFDFSRFDTTWRCIIAGDFKFIWSSNGTDQLYDISSDQGELRNLIDDEPDVARQLSLALDEWRESLGTSTPTTGGPYSDHDTRDALKALGYAQ